MASFRKRIDYHRGDYRTDSEVEFYTCPLLMECFCFINIKSFTEPVIEICNAAAFRDVVLKINT